MREYEPADHICEEGEAEYDASEYQYQILDSDSEIVVLCHDKELRDKILNFLNDSSEK